MPILLKDLPKNTYITLALEPYSSVLASILTFYAALYMQALGMDAKQIGLITTLGAVAGVLTQSVAGPIINRMGRKRALLVFSLLCWSIPLLLWALADGFMLLLLAALFFSFAKITSVAWYCVISDDLESPQKPKVFGLLFIIGSVGGLGTVLVGPVIDRFGLVPSMRFLYIFACISMTLMFVVRHLLLRETKAGSAVNCTHAGLSLAGSVLKHLDAVRESLDNREFLRLAVVFVLFNFILGMGFVQTLFINNVLKLTVAQLSLMPPLAAAVGIVLYRFVVPHLRAANERALMAAALMAFAAGLFLLLLIAPHNIGLALLVSGIAAAGAYLFQVVINTALNNCMGLLHKADAYSAVLLLVAIVTIPAGYVAGSLFELWPPLAILCMTVIACVATVLILLPVPSIAKNRIERECDAVV
ncbi:MAG: MFS transporter [Armatimonadota bacterium]